MTNPPTITTAVRDLALATAKRLENPDTWCQGSFALSADGDDVSAGSPEAVEFCAIGHMIALAEDTRDAGLVRIGLFSAIRAVCGKLISVINDMEGREAAREALLRVVRECPVSDAVVPA